MKIKDVYSGEDLGAAYAPSHTTFRVWAPTAGEVELWLYPRGDGEEVLRKLPMSHDDHGTWYVSVDGDLNHIYYTYRIRRGKKVVYAQDPYAVAAGINGMRSMVVDLRETDPQGFAKDRGPKVKNRTDLIICEISVADMTADSSAGVAHPGKFLGLTEQKTKNKNGQMTGLSYLKELGITHVQIMPMFDFASINEAYTDHEQYNWGYDPFNYNVPEGSYATDPYHGEVRIREMKEMIAAFHKAGIGVIMDVVYNHTYDLNHCLQKCEPDYYYRKKGKAYANG
jgi:pullulanase